MIIEVISLTICFTLPLVICEPSFSKLSLTKPIFLIKYSLLSRDNSFVLRLSQIFSDDFPVLNLPLAELGQLQVLTLDGDFLLAVWHEKYVDLQERCARWQLSAAFSFVCFFWHQM